LPVFYNKCMKIKIHLPNARKEIFSSIHDQS
jgi:hypothetical protein